MRVYDGDMLFALSVCNNSLFFSTRTFNVLLLLSVGTRSLPSARMGMRAAADSARTRVGVVG